jgi:hypothetical protein
VATFSFKLYFDMNILYIQRFSVMECVQTFGFWVYLRMEKNIPGSSNLVCRKEYHWVGMDLGNTLNLATSDFLCYSREQLVSIALSTGLCQTAEFQLCNFYCIFTGWLLSPVPCRRSSTDSESASRWPLPSSPQSGTSMCRVSNHLACYVIWTLYHCDAETVDAH